jgi:hypothetical protein
MTTINSAAPVRRIVTPREAPVSGHCLPATMALEYKSMCKRDLARSSCPCSILLSHFGLSTTLDDDQACHGRMSPCDEVILYLKPLVKRERLEVTFTALPSMISLRAIADALQVYARGNSLCAGVWTQIAEISNIAVSRRSASTQIRESAARLPA